ncbi:S41 family peptidase [Shewanella loihica]|uniref:Peptidase S41 n=1 Tax=Shewanella loihica (strain ATCC BAA-1088 / PV-4) TaxID=323850 RepID=A3QJL9_SHELP|nr:S41 family peptidase [Shewanella loihica]ABO25667.1 peptidase S41 [Shewanella loihica PV-4]
MKTSIRIMVLLLSLLAAFGGVAKPSIPDLDFETYDKFPADGWRVSGGEAGYSFSVDDKVFQRGQRSVSVEFKRDKPNAGSFGYGLALQAKGQNIKLRGAVKTEGITDGWAGLMLNVHPNQAFSNMREQKLFGDNDWRDFEISLDVDLKNASAITVGGVLSGNGKVWFDDLQILIDDKPLTSSQLREIPRAYKDDEFDAGSKLVLSGLDEATLVNLDLLGRVWGFLKYHHPNVGRGDYNWDYELFRFLPDYLSAVDVQERDKSLVGWIDRLGKVTPCIDCKVTNQESVLKPDHRWFYEFGLSKELIKKLNSVYEDRRQGASFYVTTNSRRRVIFSNEKAYFNMPYPDDGFRLLALYRYWNIVQYFFPYKYLTDKEWSGVLAEYLPLFLGAKNRLDYEKVTLSLIAELKDTHANLWAGRGEVEKMRGEFYPPVFTRFVEGELVVVDFYTDNESNISDMSRLGGLSIGDVITEIDGVAVEKLVKDKLRYYPASNEASRLRDIAPDLLRSNKAEIDISFRRDKLMGNTSLKLFKKDELDYFYLYRKPKGEKSYKNIDGDIGYVTLATIEKEDVDSIKNQFKDAAGIIIDIRNYPNTPSMYSLGSFFVEDKSAFAKFTYPNINNPGEFGVGNVAVLKPSEVTFKGKLVVLVNENTQSQAEFTAMAFRAGRDTTIIGSKTSGADGNMVRLDLPGGLRTAFSGLGVYYPDGGETQRVGIIPDIEVRPTIVGVREGRDELVETAIEVIKTSSVGR